MKRAIVYLFFLIITTVAHTQSISGVINNYGRVSSLSGNTLTIDAVHNSTQAATDFGIGRKVLILQVKGADMTTGNNSSHGTITDYGVAGNYEFAFVTAISGSGSNYTLTLTTLTRTYNAAMFLQLVSVPQYTNVTVAGNITAPSWSEAQGYGGVVVIEVAGTLTLNASFNVGGAGFRGGSVNTNYNNTTCNTSYDGNSVFRSRATDTEKHGMKGEGIVAYNSRPYSRGKNANGGGGGNLHNGGGAGGGNFTAGGNGGRGYNTGATCFTDGGGIGAQALDYNATNNKIFMGGGGGAGQQNNGVATAGAHGGGIIIVRAGTVATSCSGTFGFYADGNNAATNTGNDGAGGGGAGGTLLLEVNVWNTGSCNIVTSARGGNGGTVNNGGAHGGGGGGGSGALLFKTTPPAAVQQLNTEGVAGRDCNGGSCVATGTPGGTCTTCTGTGWSVPGTVVILPIEFGSIHVDALEGMAALEWTLISSKGLKYFEVERSTNMTDIQKLATISTNTKSYYSYTDTDPLSGKSYYRVKGVDEDGSATYSQWVVLQNAEPLKMTVAPNPGARGQSVQMRMAAASDVSITITDLSGVVIKTMTVSDEEAESGVVIFDADMPATGIYIIRAESDGQSTVQKLIIQP